MTEFKLCLETMEQRQKYQWTSINCEYNPRADQSISKTKMTQMLIE